MKYISYLIPLLFAALLTGCQDGGPETQPESDVANEVVNPAIWVAEDDDNQLYLFGTTTFLGQDTNWESAAVNTALADATTVFLETEISPGADMEALLVTQKLGLYSGGERLSDNLNDYQIKLLSASAHNAELPLGTLDNMKPWLASEILMAAAAESAGLTSEISIPKAILKKADNQAKELIFLDEANIQLEDIAGVAVTSQISLLTNVMERYDTLGVELKKQAENWTAGDIAAMAQANSSMFGLYEVDDGKALMGKRNERWAEQLESFMGGTETGFAVIDIAHLLGSDSLQFLLRERGYTVRKYRETDVAE